MSRVSKYKGKTASQIANEQYQFRKDKEFREDIKPLNKKKKKEKKKYFMEDPIKNEIASLTPPRKGPTPQGLKNGDEIKVGKGLKFRSSGDISYEKSLKPGTDAKITYDTKKKEVKNVKFRTNILGGDLVVGKDKYGTTANYSKDLLKGSVNISGYKTPKDKGIGFQFVKKFQIGALSDLGCPHRENGVQGSDIKGVKPIQVKGKKFIGVK